MFLLSCSGLGKKDGPWPTGPAARWRLEPNVKKYALEDFRVLDGGARELSDGVNASPRLLTVFAYSVKGRKGSRAFQLFFFFFSSLSRRFHVTNLLIFLLYRYTVVIQSYQLDSVKLSFHSFTGFMRFTPHAISFHFQVGAHLSGRGRNREKERKTHHF